MKTFIVLTTIFLSFSKILGYSDPTAVSPRIFISTKAIAREIAHTSNDFADFSQNNEAIASWLEAQQNDSDIKDCDPMTPPLVTDNSYWRLVTQGKAVVIPGTEIKLGVIDDPYSTLATDQIAFWQYNKPYYALARKARPYDANLLDYPIIDVSVDSKLAQDYHITLEELDDIPVGTIISTIKAPLCTHTVSKPQLSPELEEYLTGLGLQHWVMVATDWIYDDEEPFRKTSFDCDLIACQEDVDILITSADEYRIATPVSDGIWFQFSSFRADWRNYDCISVANYNNHSTPIEFYYNLGDTYDPRVYRTDDITTVDTLADISTTYTPTPAMLQDLQERFTSYEAEMLPPDIVRGILEIPASTRLAIDTFN